ncbi:ISL3 family transposase [bacterium]|nr:ISL3 family transposase [bacterium]
MSTSLLYHGWGLQDYQHVRALFDGGRITFRIAHKPGSLRCASCGSFDVINSGQQVRRFRSLPIGSKPVIFELPIQRLHCKSCGLVRQARLGFADPRRTYTRAFERYALDLCRCLSILDVARHLQVSWDMIKDIQKRHLRRKYARPRLKQLRRIAIDEISIGKGHRYLTVVLDLETGAVVFVGEGKSAASLRPFWKKLRCAGAKILAVATDMGKAYILAVRQNIPEAVHVFDRFHVIKLFNDHLATYRRRLQRTLPDVEQRRALKGTRWLLLKNRENLDGARNEMKRLARALRINRPLAMAYYLKEDLRRFWEQADKPQATRFLDDWIGRAQASGIGMLKHFAAILQTYRDGLLGWYDCRISTAALEGTNTKIKLMQRKAYGFRDPEFFKLKIYALHDTNYASAG